LGKSAHSVQKEDKSQTVKTANPLEFFSRFQAAWLCNHHTD